MCLTNKNNINIYMNKKNVEIEFGEARYLNKSSGLSIVEIKEVKEKKIKFLELDDNLYENESQIIYRRESIYIINYYDENNSFITYGIINDINNSQLILSCNIKKNSNGSPIFNLSNNKLIGICLKHSRYYVKGIFFQFLIYEFLEEYKYSKKAYKYNSKNEINILIKIEKKDIDKKIYYLDNYEDETEIKSNHDNLKELNEQNIEIYKDVFRVYYKKYFKPYTEGLYNFTLKFNINLTDCSYMFAGCKNIIKINFISFNTRYITNMKYMFYGCRNLQSINLFSLDTRNVKDMSYMFFDCWNIDHFDLSSFNTKNVINLNNIISNRWEINRPYYNVSSKDINNEIYLLVKVDEEDINKTLNFVKSKELNEKNAEIYINKKKYTFRPNLIIKEEGEYDIFLRFHIDLTDCTNMFRDCKNIIYIKFISFNMKKMFLMPVLCLAIVII